MVIFVDDYLTNSGRAPLVLWPVHLKCYLMIAMLIRWLLTIQMEIFV
jgi:hypothetical protein